MSDQTAMEEVNTVLRQFWEIDNSGVESLPATTLEEKMVMEQAERSMKFGDGHYQIAIPSKQSNFLLPDNYVSFQQLQNLERHLTKDPDVAKAYSEIIEKHFKKGYVRKIESHELCEKQPTAKWHGIYHILL